MQLRETAARTILVARALILKNVVFGLVQSIVANPRLPASLARVVIEKRPLHDRRLAQRSAANTSPPLTESLLPASRRLPTCVVVNVRSRP